MIRIALLSKWHIHSDDYRKDVQDTNSVELVCVWDEDPIRGRAWAKELDIEFMEDIDLLLARDDIDAVVVTCATNIHKEVMVKAANAKKHIFTEKVLASTVEECKEIEKAVERAGIKFCISTPYKTMPEFIYAKQLLEDGQLGDITSMRIRSSHDGAIGDWLPQQFYNQKESCGGAFLDLGCHAVYISTWLFGKPISLTATHTHFSKKEVEDNVVVTVEFSQGLIAVLEISFVSFPKIRDFELHGTKGSLRSLSPMSCLSGLPLDLKLYLSDSKVQGWITPEVMPKNLPTCAAHWIECILNDKTPIYDMNSAILLTEIMEAAYLSNKENRKVFLSEIGL